MADQHGHGMQNINPLSNNSSSNDSLEELAPFLISGIGPSGTAAGAGGSSSQQPTPPSAPSSARKPRGRPPGSKNKPKPPLVITQDNEQAMKPAMIEVAAGTDIIEAITQFALRRESSLSIMSGSGTVHTAQIHNPLSPIPDYTIYGPFTILQFTGTFVPAPPPHPITLIGLSNPPPPPPPALSLFGIMLTGVQGQVFGGVVGGKVVAGGDGVTVMTTLYKNPELHRAGGVTAAAADDDDDGDDNNPNPDAGGGGDPGAGPSGHAAAAAADPGAGSSAAAAAAAGGGGDIGAGPSVIAAAGFNAVNPNWMMNFQAPSDPSFMQWTHPRPPNY